MALAQRIESLRKRHAEIDMKILAETSRPLPDHAELHRLKAMKLGLKDDINRLADRNLQAA
jgi:hypothetical protein